MQEGQADIFNLLGLLLELGRSYLPQEAGMIEKNLKETPKFLSLFFFVVLASSWICGLICGGEQGFGFENKPVGAFSGFDFGCFCILLTTCKSSTADQMNKRTVLISLRFYKASSLSLMLIKDVYYVPKSCIAASLNSDI